MVKMFIVLGVVAVFLLLMYFLDKKIQVSEEQSEKWRTDPDNWKLGIFYFNPQDKRMLPPKRLKMMGWTVNLANPVSVIGMIVVLGIIFALEYYL